MALFPIVTTKEHYLANSPKIKGDKKGPALNIRNGIITYLSSPLLKRSMADGTVFCLRKTIKKSGFRSTRFWVSWVWPPTRVKKINSVPPSETGGNIDINELGVGSTLYLPVKVNGALFYTGDPHFAQGDGEVALTALEASLRGTLRLTVLKKGDPSIPRNGEFTQPFAETDDYWIPIGLDPDLDEAMKEAVRESIAFLSEKLGMSREVAYAYLSAATDYEVSQVVDRTKGIHGLIRKTDFLESLSIHVNVNGKHISPTVINNDKFYVPLRDIVEELGGTVAWDSATRSAVVTLQGKSITVKNDSNLYHVDGKEIYNEGIPHIINEKTMIPVKTVRDILGAYVNWTTSGKELHAAVALSSK